MYAVIHNIISTAAPLTGWVSSSSAHSEPYTLLNSRPYVQLHEKQCVNLSYV